MVQTTQQVQEIQDLSTRELFALNSEELTTPSPDDNNLFDLNNNSAAAKLKRESGHHSTGKSLRGEDGADNGRKDDKKELTRIQAIQILQDQINDIQRQIDEINSEIAKIDSEIAHYQQRLTTIETEISTLESRKADIQEQQKETAQEKAKTRADLDEVNDKIDKTEQEIKEAQRLEAEQEKVLENATAQVQTAKTDFENNLGGIDEMAAAQRLSNAKEKVSQEQEKLESLQNSEASSEYLQQEKDQLIERRDSLQDRIDAMEQREENLQRQFDEIEAQIDDLTSEGEIAKEKIEELQAQKADLESQKIDLQESLETKENLLAEKLELEHGIAANDKLMAKLEEMTPGECSADDPLYGGSISYRDVFNEVRGDLTEGELSYLHHRSQEIINDQTAHSNFIDFHDSLKKEPAMSSPVEHQTPFEKMLGQNHTVNNPNQCPEDQNQNSSSLWSAADTGIKAQNTPTGAFNNATTQPTVGQVAPENTLAANEDLTAKIPSTAAPAMMIGSPS